jgi:hypothetical protein
MRRQTDNEPPASRPQEAPGATMLHMHVRNPETGKSSTDCDQYPYFLGRLKAAVPQLAYHGRRFRSQTGNPSSDENGIGRPTMFASSRVRFRPGRVRVGIIVAHKHLAGFGRRGRRITYQ